MIEVSGLTIRELRERQTNGELSATDLVGAYQARIAAFDQTGPKLNAVISLNPEALAEAQRLDVMTQRGEMAGSLHGIPVLVKDNIETAGLATTAGSLSLAGYVPAADAFLIRRLKQAGAVILGKTNLHEFAIWGETVSSIAGQTLNPYDLGRSPGGSSGGTGAAVAANFCAAGIGTDTVNSVRSPASANCLVGVRPTLGLVSRSGIIPYSLTQDTAGPLTRTVADAAVVLTAIAGSDPDDRCTQACYGKPVPDYAACLDPAGLSGKRLGVIRSFFGSDAIHSPVNDVMSTALTRLAKSGAELIEVNLPWDPELLIRDVSVHLYDFKDHLDTFLSRLAGRTDVASMADIVASGKYHPGISDILQRALQLSTTGAAYQERLNRRQQVIKEMQKLFSEHRLDALVYPHQKRLVAPVGQPQLERNGVLAAVTGFPAITLPAGFSLPTRQAPVGVPVGIEFMGLPWSEPALFALTYAFEQAAAVRKPPVLQQEELR